MSVGFMVSTNDNRRHGEMPKDPVDAKIAGVDVTGNNQEIGTWLRRLMTELACA
ncbi:MAG TPA: hypothetical protein VHC04_02390 [Rhodopila sp.]|nr:hypothetical protein [Rhodopila sp.]HVZ06737.1 hypothetical protein [Rhodopila sp.]